MDELSDYSSEVVEFLPTARSDDVHKKIEKTTATDPLPASKEISVQTNKTHDGGTQTQIDTTKKLDVEVQKLADWLKKIYPAVEEQLLKGITPLSDNIEQTENDLNIQNYQKITIENVLENSQGLAIWLTVHTNNAPILAVTTVAPHDDWCEHVEQEIHIFVPQRIKNNFIVFNKEKSVLVESCLKSLCTNNYDKSIFAGSSWSGDILVWKCEQKSTKKNIEVVQMFKVNSPSGYAVALDWATENCLFSAHENGAVVQWLIAGEMLKGSDLNISYSNACNEITTILCLNIENFIIGTKDGGVFMCHNTTASINKKQLRITAFKKHQFAVTTLLKGKLPGDHYVISCDMSGQIYFHDLNNTEQEGTTIVIQVPLPFKTAIAASRDGNIIYSPGIDGSLECYGKNDGMHATIKGALSGKANFIKISDNGYWLITGLYGNDFQIFHIED